MIGRSFHDRRLRQTVACGSPGPRWPRPTVVEAWKSSLGVAGLLAPAPPTCPLRRLAVTSLRWPSRTVPEKQGRPRKKMYRTRPAAVIVNRNGPPLRLTPSGFPAFANGTRPPAGRVFQEVNFRSAASRAPS